jgi:hypothetical protein
VAVPDGQDTGARQFGEPPATRGRWLSRRPLVRAGVRRKVRHPFEPNQLPSVGIKTEVGADWPLPRLVFLAVCRDFDQDRNWFIRAAA